MADEGDLKWCIVHKVVLDSSFVGETFFKAMKIWLERPQVLNRRLVGSYVFQSFQTSKNVDVVLGDVLALSKENGLVSHEKLLKLGDKFRKTIACDTGTQDDIVRAQIRKLLPRQSSKYKNVSEVVIQDIKSRNVMFIPFEDETPTEIISKIENAYKVSLENHVDDSHSSLVLSVLSQSVSGDGITCPTVEWLKSCLLPKIHKWMKEDGLNVKNFGSSLQLVPVDKYTKRYEELKKKYKHFVKMWPERTDPHKFVYEDVAIATYLLLLWENDQNDEVTRGKTQTFVDLGCGNGLLVHILTNEGHVGKGIDLRPRKVWSFYDNKTNLEVTTLDPSSLIYPDVDWLIGNHSDELTPWIPVIAARSSHNCKYFVLPCCFHDFYYKFQRGSSNDSQYRSYLNYVRTVGQTCGFDVEEDVLRIPSTKKVCQIGQRRVYPPTEQDFIEQNISAMLLKTRYCNSKENDRTYEVDIAQSKITNDMGICCSNETASLNHHATSISQQEISQHPDKVCKMETHQAYNVPQSVETLKQDSLLLLHNETVGNEPSRTNNYDQQCKLEKHCKDMATCYQENEMEVSQPLLHGGCTLFVPRCEKEPVKNCTQLDKKLLETIIQTVATELLSRFSKPSESEGVNDWNKGGCMRLNEVSRMFDQNVLNELRCEAGGIKTVLRNCHQVFKVQDGMVEIRDWRERDADKASTKRKRQNAGNTSKYWKTKHCWFYNHHPNGCPLLQQQCSFAHGMEDLKLLPAKHI